MTKIALAGLGTLLFIALFIEILVVPGASSESGLGQFYANLDGVLLTAIVVTVLGWAVLSAVVTAVVVRRMSDAATWDWNRPNSVWRAVRGSLVIMATVGVPSIVPAFFVSSAMPEPIGTPVASILWLAGFLAAPLAGLMYAIGGAVRLDKSRDR